MINNIFHVLWIAMLPVFELRLALPMAYFKYGFNIYESFILSVIGNMIPIFFILLLLEYFVKIFSKWSFFKKIFDWIYSRSEKAFSKNYAKWGKFGLILFVGIPLPITGAWTGSVASILFKIKTKEAFFLIFFGVLLAGVIVSTICLFFENFALKWLM